MLDWNLAGPFCQRPNTLVVSSERANYLQLASKQNHTKPTFQHTEKDPYSMLLSSREPEDLMGSQYEHLQHLWTEKLVIVMRV